MYMVTSNEKTPLSGRIVPHVMMSWKRLPNKQGHKPQLLPMGNFTTGK